MTAKDAIDFMTVYPATLEAAKKEILRLKMRLHEADEVRAKSIEKAEIIRRSLQGEIRILKAEITRLRDCEPATKPLRKKRP